MRILLVDPHDSPRRGPWSAERWDSIVDLGKSSQWSAEAWRRQHGCAVIRSDSYREKIADVRRVREMLSVGHGRLVDEEGIDWWNLTSLLLVPDALELLAMQRVATEIPVSAEVWATRRSGVVRLLEIVLGRELQFFEEAGWARVVARAFHYAGIAQHFSATQIKEILLDKYDPGYRWRARVARTGSACKEPVVLVPTAYGNVSRMAAAYMRQLPRQKFLMVATRQNAKQLVVPDNAQMRDLAEYAGTRTSAAEIASLLQHWVKLNDELQASPEMRVLSQAGVLNSLPNWIRDGISVRNAWLGVLMREPVQAVLCGDDSNRYTRLPVLLAAARRIPTVDFHHGALDGYYLLKNLPCDVYMAKNEMERDYQVRVCGMPNDRVVVAAPAPQSIRSLDERSLAQRSFAAHGKAGSAIVLFSEPYDVLGMRSEEVYREIVPPLCRLAREHGRDVILKLHPFESRAERNNLLRDVLAHEDFALVKIVDGPLTAELMTNTWFGVTIESTTVLDCLQNGVACFLCGWLTLSPYEYPEQYARFGVGEILARAEQIADIPRRVEEFRNRPAHRAALGQIAESDLFGQWLGRGGDRAPEECSGMKAIS